MVQRGDCTGRSSQRITIASNSNGSSYRCADTGVVTAAATAVAQCHSSFQDVLLAANATNNNTLKAVSAPGAAIAAGARALASPPSIDLDLLLLDRDSVDAFDDHHHGHHGHHGHHQYQQHPHAHYHQYQQHPHVHHHQYQQQQQSCHGFSSALNDQFSPLPLPLVRNGVSRHEVTAVQAFLDEWRDDDDASGVDVVGSRALAASSTERAKTSARRRGQRGASRATAAPSRQPVQSHSDATVSVDASLATLAPSSLPSTREPRVANESATEPTAQSKAPAKSTTKTKSAVLTTSLTKSKPKPKPKTVGTREREKEEAIQLRKEALQLRQHLEQLRQSVQRAADASAEPPLWKRVAERQHERLLLARMDNQSLRVAVREQKQMAKSLHRVLLNRVAQVATLQPRLKSLAPWHAVGESPDDASVFEQLFATASAMFAQTDRVARALAAKSPACGGAFRQWRVKQSAATPYIELVDVSELPFSVAQVNNLLHTLAQHTATRRVPKGDRSGSGNNDGDGATTVQATVLMGKEEYRSSTRPRAPRMRYVNLNVVEPTRTVFMYCSFLDAVSSTDGTAVPGRILQERKWIVVRSRAPTAGVSAADVPAASSASPSFSPPPPSSSPPMSSLVSGSATGGTSATVPATTTTTTMAAGPHQTVIETYSTITPMATHPLATRDDAWTRESIERMEIPMWDRGYTLLAQKIENDLLAATGAAAGVAVK